MTEYKENDIKVLYIPQVPMPAFEVLFTEATHPYLSYKQRVQVASATLDVLAEFSEFEYQNRVKPDFSDVGAVTRYEPDGEGGFDWFDLDETEIEYILESHD